MNDRLSRALLLLLLALAPLACATEPRLMHPWAKKYRELESPKMPKGDRLQVRAKVGDEERSLVSWCERAKAGDTIDVVLKPGTYALEDAVVADGVRLVIRGPGLDQTRLELDSDSWRTLTVKNSPGFELRGVTVVGLSGGGIDVHRCDRVVVNECNFVGLRYGLELDDSTSYVDSCVFAGNERGIEIKGGRLRVRGSALCENWWPIDGNGKVEAYGCAFFGNEEGMHLRAVSGTQFDSCLFAKPERIVAGGLLRVNHSLLDDDLKERFSGKNDDNRVARGIEEFPHALPEGFPDDMNVGAVLYALERVRNMGNADEADRIRDVLETEARVYMAGARRALEGKAKAEARTLARIALEHVVAGGGHDKELLHEIQSILP